MAGFGWAGIGSFLQGGDVAGDTAATIGSDADVFGSRPKVAKFHPTNLGDEQKLAANENLAGSDSIMAMLDKFVPGFSDRLTHGLQISDDLLHGKIPPDVQAALERSDAFKQLIGGFAGTQMGSALTARDLGLTSLDLMGKGQNSAQAWTKMAETSYDPFIIKTSQQAEMTQENNAGQQARDQLEFNVKAAPDPAAAAKFAIDSAIGMKMMDWGLGLAGGFMGGGGGGGNDMPAYGQQPGSDWRLYGGTGGATGMQYNPQTGQYQNVPVATWGGGG